MGLEWWSSVRDSRNHMLMYKNQESLEKNEFQGVEHKLLPNWLKECQACLGFHAAACLEHNQKRVNKMSNADCDGWFYRVYIPISCS